MFSTEQFPNLLYRGFLNPQFVQRYAPVQLAHVSPIAATGILRSRPWSSTVPNHRTIISPSAPRLAAQQAWSDVVRFMFCPLCAGGDSAAPSLPVTEFALAENTPSFQILCMALTPSTMLPLGTTAPDFELPDTNGELVSLADFKGAPALMVWFICNHCPYVKHIRSGLAQFARDYASKRVAIVAINSNDAENYPDDSPAKMKEEVRTAGYTFSYLYDESQDVAKAYRAACTPDIYLFDKNQKLVYRGQFDDSRPNSGVPVTGKDLRAALDAVLSGQPISATQKPSMGCNIKWKSGNEPDYF